MGVIGGGREATESLGRDRETSAEPPNPIQSDTMGRPKISIHRNAAITNMAENEPRDYARRGKAPIR